MTIIRSTVMGFCSGVQRAVELLELAVSRGKEENLPVYTIGPLIHNEQFLELQQKKGVAVIRRPDEHTPGIAVIRAHGIPPEERRAFADAGYTLIDGTCPRVRRSQQLVFSYAQKGYDVVIAGDRNHGEVVSLKGFAENTSGVYVVRECDELDDIQLDKKVLLIAQTTFSREMYLDIQKCLADTEGAEELEIIDSICPATKKRQEALIGMTENVDAVIVVGGKESANTRRLYDIALERGIQAWLISGADDIIDEMRCGEIIGITAGASTPEWVVDDVISRLKGNTDGT